MRVVTAPNHVFVRKHEVSIFVAGGITGCPDWQSEFITTFDSEAGEDNPFLLLNPRRKDFDINEKDIGQQQIEWEYDCLNKADIVVFWFCAETLCPIVLYELGFRLARNSMLDEAIFSRKQSLLIGVHPEYQRRDDVVIQSRLVDPKLNIYRSVNELACEAAVEAIEKYQNRDFGEIL